jgi:hypothetical protein
VLFHLLAETKKGWEQKLLFAGGLAKLLAKHRGRRSLGKKI